MANTRRKDRLESLLRREIANCLVTELRDPRLGFITVTRVALSIDRQFATAYYTVLGDEKQKKHAAIALRSACPYVQRAYAKHVQSRTLPQLRFEFDERDEKRMNMDELIRKARESDPKQADSSSADDNDSTEQQVDGNDGQQETSAQQVQ